MSATSEGERLAEAPSRRLRAVPRPLQGIRIPGIAVATLVLLVFAVLSLAPALGTYLTTQQEVADTTARVAAQTKDLQRLDAQKARWSDPAYIRAQAGSRLFYVMPGEVTYRVVGGTTSAVQPAAQAPTSTVQATRTDWTSSLLASLLAAGTTDETPATLAGDGR